MLSAKIKNIPIRRIKVVKKEPDFTESFNIRDVREMLNGNDMTQELHRHDFFFVLVLLNGSGTHEIDFYSFDVCDHSVFFMRPGQVHQLKLKKGSTGYLMQFSRDFYYPNDDASRLLLRKASNKNLCQLNAQAIEKLYAILTSIFKEYTEQQEGHKEVIKANLGIFFIELIRHRQHKKDLPAKNMLYAQERVEEFLELLETYIFEHKEVSYYAEKLNLSSYQLNTITKTTLGKKCSELINEHIILESKRYLLATSNQVNQIAYHLGYEDVSYFIRFFKKHTGYSPESFRHNFR